MNRWRAVMPFVRVLMALVLAVGALVAVLALDIAPSGAAAPNYTVADLGVIPFYGEARTPWGDLFSPLGVTSTGAVLFPIAGLLVKGSYERPSNATTPTDTDTPGSMLMLAVNDHSLVVGFIQHSDSDSAAIWPAGADSKYRSIDFSSMLPAGAEVTSSMAEVVDNAGEIGGSVSYSVGNSGAVAYFSMATPTAKPVAVTDPKDGSAAQLLALNSPWELGRDVTGSGEVFTYNRATAVRTAVPEAAYRLSSNGTVLTGPTEVTSGGQTITLSPGPGVQANATSISNHGIAVGQAIGPQGQTTFGEWDRSGAFTDLSGLAPVTLSAPVIGPSGRIVAVNYSGETTSHAYLLTPPKPVPPVVNSNGDAAALDDGADGCDTGVTVQIGGQPQAECTLRAAIQAANSADDAEPITFAIPASSGSITIHPLSPLPPITASGTVLDFTQNAPVLLVRGFDSSTAAGLDVQASNVTIKRADTVGWPRSVLLEAPGSDTVIASTLGASPSSPSQGDTVGVEVRNSPNDTIGAATSADANVLARDDVGVYVDGASSNGTKIEGNLIGVDADGTTQNPNGVGVLIRDSSNVTVGGAAHGAGNVVDASGTPITVIGIAHKATDNTIAGNLIGVDRTGTESFATSCANAITIAGTTLDTQIGGGAGAGNVISARCSSEVSVDSTETSGTKIVGNLIGTNAAGTAVINHGAMDVGIRVEGATHTTVGVAGEGNTIAGFNSSGVITTAKSEKVTLSFPQPVQVPGSDATRKGASGDAIGGNTIGVTDDASKFVADPGDVGVLVGAGSGDTVRGNLVSGCVVGIDVKGAKGAETVDGNKLGVDRTGLRSLENGIDVVIDKSDAARVGDSSRPNIAFGHGAGLEVEQSAQVSVRDNHVGVTATGDAAIGKARDTPPKSLAEIVDKLAHAGIEVDKDSPHTVLSANDVGSLPGDGIVVAAAKDVEVDGNHVGVGANGRAAVGNDGAGLRLRAPVNPVVGATLTGHANLTVTGDGNLIAHNKGAGVELMAVTAPRLLSDRLWSNGGGGVVVTGKHPHTPSDPALNTAVNRAGHTELDVRIGDADDGVLQVFRAASCGAHPQGETLLDTVAITKGTEHKLKLKIEPVGTDLIATYTVPAHGTSAYSRCTTVAAGNG